MSVRSSSADDRRKELRILTDRVRSTLELANRRYTVIQYPTKYKERSIDLIAINRNRENVVIRIRKTPTLSRDEVRDLIKASMAFDAVPMIVSCDRGLYDNIVYEREGVFILNDRTLENMYLRPNELVVFYKRGELFIPVNRENLIRARSGRTMSLGEVAYFTGISRRTLFSYEREGGLVTIETAERLVEVLGSDVIESVNLKLMKKEFKRRVAEAPSVEHEKEPVITRDILGEGKVYGLKKSAPDYLVKRTGSEVDIIVDALTNVKLSIRDIVKKTIESLKISELSRGDVEVIVDKGREGVVKDELSSYVDLNRLDIVAVKRMS